MHQPESAVAIWQYCAQLQLASVRWRTENRQDAFALDLVRFAVAVIPVTVTRAIAVGVAAIAGLLPFRTMADVLIVSVGLISSPINHATR